MMSFDLISKSDATLRFSNRVDDYSKYRPGYPQEAINYLFDGMELDSQSTIADVGAGTGIFTELLLSSEAQVVAIEPNEAMRAASDQRLNTFSNYKSLAGTAEITTLADASVDLLTAAQAFHWFSIEKSKQEFQRILKPNGQISLIWNRRICTHSEFLEHYEFLLKSRIPEYNRVNHSNASDEVIRGFLGQNMSKAEFTNSQSFNLEGLKGRLLSSSYCPPVGEAGHTELMVELENLYEKHSTNGRVKFDYLTQVYKAMKER
jgi:ubiquinone/menaquinone biosynthesis C-methylase UbiE